VPRPGTALNGDDFARHANLAGGGSQYWGVVLGSLDPDQRKAEKHHSRRHEYRQPRTVPEKENAQQGREGGHHDARLGRKREIDANSGGEGRRTPQETAALLLRDNALPESGKAARGALPACNRAIHDGRGHGIPLTARVRLC
jgi:hypothetical protein